MNNEDEMNNENISEEEAQKEQELLMTSMGMKLIGIFDYLDFTANLVKNPFLDILMKHPSYRDGQKVGYEMMVKILTAYQKHLEKTYNIRFDAENKKIVLPESTKIEPSNN